MKLCTALKEDLMFEKTLNFFASWRSRQILYYAYYALENFIPTHVFYSNLDR